MKNLSRRKFATTTGALLGSLAAATPLLGEEEKPSADEKKETHKFKHHYAPHFGMFKESAGKDLIDQLKFMADQGFTALEDNGLMNRPPDVQEKIGKELDRLGMTMGVFVTYANFEEPTFTTPTDDSRAMLKKRMNMALETAKRVNAKWTTVVPGTFVNHLEWGYQTANVVDVLKSLAEICEPSGLVMVLEPLNPWTNHPGCFLTKIPQAYEICKAVNSPSCKILDDLYHQQITEGNLIPNMIKAWDEIAYIQVGSTPGRKEPYTGEVDFNFIFKWLYEKGWKGVIGMEHGNSKPGKEGEQLVIDSYRRADDFPI